jgi:hypothetical protein
MRLLTLTVLLALVPPQVGASRQTIDGAAAPGPADLDRMLARFFDNADEYERAFRNLTAEETKVIEVFKKSGGIDKRRQIVSDLIVYYSARDPRDVAIEYRDVRSVDGKAVERRGPRALQLLTKAAAAKNVQKELEAIARETHRYEFNNHIMGLTIYQGMALKGHRDSFAVEWAGRDRIAGRDVVVIDYRQTGPVPRHGWNLSLPREFGKPEPVHRGRLLLDAETFQLRRQVWEVLAPHPAAPGPIPIIRQEAVYAQSRFGILVPERIALDLLFHFSHPKNTPPSMALSERMTFTYGVFRRFDVATEEQIDLPATGAR